LGPNSGGPLSIHTHIIIHLKFGSALLPKGKLLNEREREREKEKHQETCVFRVSRVGHSNSPKKYSFFSLSLFLRISSICYDKLLLLHGASRVIKRKRLERMKKKKGKMCAALNPPPLSLLFTCC
jgi:hypothetical protein